jgi:hypothetical protein
MSVASPTGRVEGSRREAIRIGGLATSSMHPYRPFAARSLAAEVLTLVLASPACLPVCLSGPDRRLRTAVSSADRAESLGL